MSTIKDVARETGLGIATISKYLNGGNVREKNRVAIEAAIDKLGFTINEFARGLKTSKSYTVGVVIPELNNLFITTIITVVGNILRKKGYGVIVCDCGNDGKQEQEAVRFLMSKRVDGIVNMPVSHHGGHLAPALEANIPVVLLDRMLPQCKDRVNAVLVDNAGAANSAVQSLLDAGHSDIGIILGPAHIFTTQQRFFGYSQALMQSGIQPDSTRIIYSDYSVQGGYESMRRLLKNKGMTAVFVTNYEMTLGAIIALNESEIKIPEEISVIGFDNMQLSKVIRPKLSVIFQPLEEMGRNAADILLERLTGARADQPSRTVTLAVGIVPGESIKKRN